MKACALQPMRSSQFLARDIGQLDAARQPSLGWERWESDREEHVARHGLTRRDVEEAVDSVLFIRNLARPRARVVGQNRGGRYVTVILERLPTGRWLVLTARDADDSERRTARERRQR